MNRTVNNDPIRLAVCQPLIPAYRIPMFEKIGKEDDIELVIHAGKSRGSLHAVNQGQCFRVEQANVWEIRVLGRIVKLQWGQIRAVRSGCYDLIILPWDTGYLTLIPALMLARKKGICIVLWGHGYSKRPGWFRDYVRNMLGKYADAVLLYSSSVADRLENKFGFEHRRTFVAPNALDEQPICEAIRYWKRGTKLEKFRKCHNIDPDNTVIFISRLEPENHVDMLLYALELLLNSKPGVKLFIIGDGTDRNRLESLKEMLDLSHDVIFLGSIYDEQKISPWMLSATFFCYPVNIGLSILHAFNYALPVVTSDAVVHHNPEIDAFQNGVNGLFYKDGCVEDMSKQWLNILQDPALRKTLSSGARHTARRYTMNNMVTGFLHAVRNAHR